MYCKYCGKAIKSDMQICADCQTAIKGVERKRSSLPFYLILILGFIAPMCFEWLINIGTLISVSDDYQVYNAYKQSCINSFFYTLHNNPLLLIAAVLVLKKANKIDNCCCSKEDAVLWIGVRWIFLIFPVDLIVRSFIGSISAAWLSAYYMYGSVQTMFEMPGLWYNVCFLLFLLMRSKSFELSKKKVAILSGILVVWSMLLLIFEHSLLRIWKTPVEYFHMTADMWLFSLMFMWMRYLIFLLYVVLLARKQIGYASGVICMTVFFLLPGMLQLVLVECQMISLLGITESVGYVLSLIVLLVSKYINERMERSEAAMER